MNFLSSQFYFWSQEENYYGKPCADVLRFFLLILKYKLQL